MKSEFQPVFIMVTNRTFFVQPFQVLESTIVVSRASPPWQFVNYSQQVYLTESLILLCKLRVWIGCCVCVFGKSVRWGVWEGWLSSVPTAAHILQIPRGRQASLDLVHVQSGWFTCKQHWKQTTNTFGRISCLPSHEHRHTHGQQLHHRASSFLVVRPTCSDVVKMGVILCGLVLWGIVWHRWAWDDWEHNWESRL